MLLNISALNDYLICRRYWWYKDCEGFGLPDEPEALTLGKQWHAICAGEREPLPTDPLWMREAAVEWAAAAPLWDFRILATELPLACGLGGVSGTDHAAPHTLIGRLDALAVWQGQLWHVQHKTVRASLSFAGFVQGIRRSFHEAAYAALVNANRDRIAAIVRGGGGTQLRGTVRERGEGDLAAGGSDDNRPLPDLPYGGSILVMARKLTRNGPFLRIEPVPIEGVDEVTADLVRYADEMALEHPDWRWSGQPLPLQNRSACMGVWGNRPCDYLPLCEGRQKTMPRMPLLQGYPVEFIKEVRDGC